MFFLISNLSTMHKNVQFSHTLEAFKYIIGERTCHAHLPTSGKVMNNC